MKTRCLILLIVGLLAAPSVADAQQLVVNPDSTGVVGPGATYANGVYSPYPGIVAPVPYPGWGYPPHWIYAYMWTGDYGRGQRDGVIDGKAYRGRDNLSPAVPYADYLKDQREILRLKEAASKPAPTADKALLEIRVPNERAKLFFDGKEAAGDGDVRIFLTPALKAGQAYTFTLRTTWPGFPDDRANEQVITFQAGERKIVDLRPKN